MVTKKDCVMMIYAAVVVGICIGILLGRFFFISGITFIISITVIFVLFSAYEIYRLYRIRKRNKFKVYVVDDEGNVVVHRFKTKEGAIKFLHIMEINDVNAYIGD